MGGRGFTINQPEEIETVLDQAFATNVPVVIEAVVDPFEPMMPPKMPPSPEMGTPALDMFLICSHMCFWTA